MQRTKNHGLLYKNLCQDSSASRQGMADYLLVFRKWVDGLDRFPDPVHGSNPERFDHYVGMNPPNPNECRSARLLHGDDDGSTPRVIACDPKTGRWPNRNPFPLRSEDYRVWSINVWQRYASPVWFDINQMDVLQYREARDEKDERHLCPLQLDVIERAIHLWSNPGDLVLDPFGGIGSVPVVALPPPLFRDYQPQQEMRRCGRLLGFPGSFGSRKSWLPSFSRCRQSITTGD
jgi:hypothetical protein